MHLVKSILKTGRTITGYILNAHVSQIEVLSYEGEELKYTSFSKSALKDIEELRPLTKKEVHLVQTYASHNKKLGKIEYEIRKLKAQKDIYGQKRDKVLEALFEEFLTVENSPLETLTVKHIEADLSEIGYKNLFLLQRYGYIALGENEELYIFGDYKQLIPLLLKQKDVVISLLNKKDLDKAGTQFTLALLFKDADSSKAEQQKTSEKNTNNKKSETKGKAITVNINDIKDKLNEEGFKTLKKLEDNNVIKIKQDGTIDFKQLINFPFIKEFLEDKDMLVGMLNESIPLSLKAVVPFPFIHGLNDILTNVEKQFTTKKE